MICLLAPVCVRVRVCVASKANERERACRPSVRLMCWSLLAWSVSMRLLSVAVKHEQHLSIRTSNDRVEPASQPAQSTPHCSPPSSRSSPMSVYFRFATPMTSGPRTALVLRSPAAAANTSRICGSPANAGPENNGPNRAGIRGPENARLETERPN